MNPEIGDLIDCRLAPLGHFIVVVGTRKIRGQDEVMYYIITSRVYAVFVDILDFFNDCITRKYSRFFHKFPKEKGKSNINPHGRLRDAFFFDRQTDYNSCLTEDSMVVINRDPELMDNGSLTQLHRDGKAIHKSRTTVDDLRRLIEVVKVSDNVAKTFRTEICRNYNVFKRSHP